VRFVILRYCLGLFCSSLIVFKTSEEHKRCSCSCIFNQFRWFQINFETLGDLVLGHSGAFRYVTFKQQRRQTIHHSTDRPLDEEAAVTKPAWYSSDSILAVKRFDWRLILCGLVQAEGRDNQRTQSTIFSTKKNHWNLTDYPIHCGSTNTSHLRNLPISSYALALLKNMRISISIIVRMSNIVFAPLHERQFPGILNQMRYEVTRAVHYENVCESVPICSHQRIMKNEEWRMWNKEWRMKNEEWEKIPGMEMQDNIKY
jgi:hypothetical protein